MASPNEEKENITIGLLKEVESKEPRMHKSDVSKHFHRRHILSER